VRSIGRVPFYGARSFSKEEFIRHKLLDFLDKLEIAGNKAVAA
jgi:UDP-3-O-acyl-N-acetylglucosamine deacetylase